MIKKPYPVSAIFIHWLLAIGIFFLFISSWWMLSLPLPSDDFRYRVLPFQLHKNVGITLFILVLMLLYLRIRIRPAPDATLKSKPLLLKMAFVDHVLLYFLITVCCLSGYLSSSYSGWDTSLWWLVNLPAWGSDNDELNILFSDIHLWTCWALLALVAIHISAAVYHGFNNDSVVKRMSPFD